jgi:Uma2 family endonuclease
MATLLTRADRDALPDDGRRHELLDGGFFVTASPGFDHQSVVMRLGLQLFQAAEGSDLVVFCTAFDVVLAEHTVVVPDVLVAPRAQFTAKDLPGAPLLVVEVRSRSTAAVDALIKRDLYEKAGVPSYWLVDPAGPSITVLELVEGRYQEVARAQGDESIHVTAPVPIRLTPSDWLGG